MALWFPSHPSFFYFFFRFLWWKKNLRRILHLQMKIGTDFSRSLRSKRSVHCSWIFFTFDFIDMNDFSRKNVKQKKAKVKEKKPYTPFPPQPQPSKVRWLFVWWWSSVLWSLSKLKSNARSIWSFSMMFNSLILLHFLFTSDQKIYPLLGSFWVNYFYIELLYMLEYDLE